MMGGEGDRDLRMRGGRSLGGETRFGGVGLTLAAAIFLVFPAVRLVAAVDLGSGF